MKTWHHSRKGRITGEVVREDDTWMWVRLAGDHTLRYMSEYNQGRVDEDGEVMCLRRSLMREVGPKETPLSDRQIDELIEKSSLGTPEAKAVRASVSDEDVQQVIDRLKVMEPDCTPSGCQCSCHRPGNGMTVTHLVACCDQPPAPVERFGLKLMPEDFDQLGEALDRITEAERRPT